MRNGAPRLVSRELAVLITSLVIGYKGFWENTGCYSILCCRPSVPFPEGFFTLYIPLSIDLSHTFVDQPGRYLSACPISRLSILPVGCSNQGSTVQGSSLH